VAMIRDAKTTFIVVVIRERATPLTAMDPAAGTKGTIPAYNKGAVATGADARMRSPSVSMIVQGGMSSSIRL